MSKIILSDDTVLNDVDISGTFITTPYKISEETFAGKLNGVKFSYEDINGEEKFTEPMLLRLQGPVRKFPHNWAAAFEIVSAEEIANLKRDANIAYLSMMSDIDLVE